MCEKGAFFALLAPLEDFSDPVYGWPFSIHFELNRLKTKNVLKQNSLHIQCSSYNMPQAALQRKVFVVQLHHTLTSCTFPFHIGTSMLINSYLNKFTMHNGNENASAAYTAIKQGNGRATFPRDAIFWLEAATSWCRKEPGRHWLFSSDVALLRHHPNPSKNQLSVSIFGQPKSWLFSP